MHEDIKDFDKQAKKKPNVNKCNKLSKDATAQERRDAHKVKMGVKKMVNAHNREQYRDGRYILANISQHHKDFGDTPSEHEARKVKDLDQEHPL